MEKQNKWEVAKKNWSLTSMTGFCQKKSEFEDLEIEVAVKTLNQRGFDCKVRCPREFLLLEKIVIDQAKKRFERGRIEISVAVLNRKGQSNLVLNKEVAKELLDSLQSFAEEQPALNTHIDAGDLLVCSDLFSAKKVDFENANLQKSLKTSVENALNECVAARKKEGELITPKIFDHLKSIASLVKNIETLCEKSVSDHFSRLKTRANELFSEITFDDERLYQEAALIVERADFKEEVDRLQVHIEHFLEVGMSPDAKGRKFDFLCQEMLREANTLQSKTNDCKIGKVNIELKAVIEKLREQVQNIE